MQNGCKTETTLQNPTTLIPLNFFSTLQDTWQRAKLRHNGMYVHFLLYGFHDLLESVEWVTFNWNLSKVTYLGAFVFLNFDPRTAFVKFLRVFWFHPMKFWFSIASGFWPQMPVSLSQGITLAMIFTKKSKEKKNLTGRWRK